MVNKWLIRSFLLHLFIIGNKLVTFGLTIMNLRILTVGFAIFTMFFGAGNITLPLILAQKWPDAWISSYIGFSLTGVLITLLGLISAVYAGSTKKFFLPLGAKIGLLIQIILILIEGPFGIVPRCFIVAYGGVKTVIPGINAWMFYLISSIIVFYFAISKTRLVSSIGNYITPALLITLIIVISYAFFAGEQGINFNYSVDSDSFYDGLVMGYLTYDLPGAVYFTGIALVYLNSLSNNQKDIFRLGIAASIVSGVLLALVYIAFFYLGVKNYSLIQNTQPEQILTTIILHSFGKIFAIIFAGFVFVACITTAIAAITIWTDFIFEHLPNKTSKYKITLAISLLIASFVANFEFSGLMKFLSPVLNLIYPILICLAIYNIYISKRKMLPQ